MESTWHPPNAARREPLARLRSTRPDPWLLVAVAGLTGFGMVMVLEATYFFSLERHGDPLYFFWKQLLALGIGGSLLFAVMHVESRSLERYATAFLLACGLLLSGLVLIGITRGGAQRWYGLGIFNVQPSEFVKIAILIYLAKALADVGDGIRRFWRGLVPILAVVGIYAGLIGAQPNFSTAAILVTVTGVMLFVGGARVWHLAALGVPALIVGFLAVYSSEYRWKRMLAVWDPWSDPLGNGYQLIQSMIGFGSGGWTGLGLGASRQKMMFLPEAHTDFIFSLVGEEFGVVGVGLVLALLAVVGLRGFRVAARHPDPFGSMLAFGLTLMLMVQAVVNVGVAVGMLPPTGLALPFISYGGSALIGAMIEVGLLASLSRVTG